MFIGSVDGFFYVFVLVEVVLCLVYGMDVGGCYLFDLCWCW